MCTRVSPQAKIQNWTYFYSNDTFSQLIFIPLSFLFIYNVYNFPSNVKWSSKFHEINPFWEGISQRWHISMMFERSISEDAENSRKRFSGSTIEQIGESCWRVLCFQVITRQIHESDEIVLEFQLKPIDPLDISRLGFPSTIHFSCLVSRESGIHFNIDETISKKNERRKGKSLNGRKFLFFGETREALVRSAWKIVEVFHLEMENYCRAELGLNWWN